MSEGIQALLQEHHLLFTSYSLQGLLDALPSAMIVLPFQPVRRNKQLLSTALYSSHSIRMFSVFGLGLVLDSGRARVKTSAFRFSVIISRSWLGSIHLEAVWCISYVLEMRLPVKSTNHTTVAAIPSYAETGQLRTLMTQTRHKCHMLRNRDRKICQG